MDKHHFGYIFSSFTNKCLNRSNYLIYLSKFDFQVWPSSELEHDFANSEPGRCRSGLLRHQPSPQCGLLLLWGSPTRKQSLLCFCRSVVTEELNFIFLFLIFLPPRPINCAEHVIQGSRRVMLGETINIIHLVSGTGIWSHDLLIVSDLP